MATGTVKWFNPAKGYGFIQPEDGSRDVFVHISAVEKAGLDTLNEGRKVSFEVVPGDGKSSAENLGKSSAENLAVSLDSTIVKVHPDGTGALKKTDPSRSEDPEAAGPPSFIWLPRMPGRP